MRIQSKEPRPEKLLGELAGRWYIDRQGRFKRNRRHRKNDRRREAAHYTAADLVAILAYALPADADLEPTIVDPAEIPPNE